MGGQASKEGQFLDCIRKCDLPGIQALFDQLRADYFHFTCTGLDVKMTNGSTMRVSGIVALSLSTLKSSDDPLSMLIANRFPVLSNSRLETALHIAATRGDATKLRMLVAYRPHVRFQRNCDGWTAFDLWTRLAHRATTGPAAVSTAVFGEISSLLSPDRPGRCALRDLTSRHAVDPVSLKPVLVTRNEVRRSMDIVLLSVPLAFVDSSSEHLDLSFSTNPSSSSSSSSSTTSNAKPLFPPHHQSLCLVYPPEPEADVTRRVFVVQLLLEDSDKTPCIRVSGPVSRLADALELPAGSSLEQCEIERVASVQHLSLNHLMALAEVLMSRFLELPRFARGCSRFASSLFQCLSCLYGLPESPDPHSFSGLLETPLTEDYSYLSPSTAILAPIKPISAESNPDSSSPSPDPSPSSRPSAPQPVQQQLAGSALISAARNAKERIYADAVKGQMPDVKWGRMAPLDTDKHDEAYLHSMHAKGVPESGAPAWESMSTAGFPHSVGFLDLRVEELESDAGRERREMHMARRGRPARELQSGHAAAEFVSIMWQASGRKFLRVYNLEMVRDASSGSPVLLVRGPLVPSDSDEYHLLAGCTLQSPTPAPPAPSPIPSHRLDASHPPQPSLSPADMELEQHLTQRERRGLSFGNVLFVAQALVARHRTFARFADMSRNSFAFDLFQTLRNLYGYDSPEFSTQIFKDNMQAQENLQPHELMLHSIC